MHNKHLVLTNDRMTNQSNSVKSNNKYVIVNDGSDDDNHRNPNPNLHDSPTLSSTTATPQPNSAINNDNIPPLNMNLNQQTSNQFQSKYSNVSYSNKDDEILNDERMAYLQQRRIGGSGTSRDSNISQSGTSQQSVQSGISLTPLMSFPPINTQITPRPISNEDENSMNINKSIKANKKKLANQTPATPVPPAPCNLYREGPYFIIFVNHLIIQTNNPHFVTNCEFACKYQL